MKLVLTLFLAATSLMAAEPAAPLWDKRVPLLKTAELPLLQDARFSVIKPYEFSKDGYRFRPNNGVRPYPAGGLTRIASFHRI